MPTAEQVLDLARQELGYQESPPNSNRTKYGQWYGLDAAPWCMIFIMWVFDQAEGLDLLPKRTASCGDFMGAAKAAKNWRTRGYQPGDVVIFDFPKTGAVTDHVGLVESVEKDAVITIEGNTGVGNDANGGMVMRRRRKLSLVLGGFRPKYAKEKGGFSIGSIVKFIGSKLYAGYGEEAAESPASEAVGRIETIRPGQNHPYYVYGDGVEGWVDAADVEPAAPEKTAAKGTVDVEQDKPLRTVIITARPSLKIRSGPGVNYAKRSSLSTGEKAVIVEERGGWGRLSGGGWISLQYTREVKDV